MVFLSWRLLRSENITLSTPAVISLVTPRGQSTCLEQAQTALAQPGSHWRGGHKVSLLRMSHTPQELRGSKTPESHFLQAGDTTWGPEQECGGQEDDLQGVTQVNPFNFQEFCFCVLRYSLTL